MERRDFLERVFPKDLVERILEMVHLSFEPSSAPVEIAPCEQYTVEDYVRFIQGLMPPLEMDEFANHCHDPHLDRSCFSCLKAIHEKYENELLLQRTMHLVDRLETMQWATDRSHEDHDLKNRIHIELAVSGDRFKIIRTTGEYVDSKLTKRTHSTKQRLLGQKQPVRITQRFEEPPVSLVASLRKGTILNSIRMRLAVQNTESQKFIPNIEIALKGTNTKETSISDKNGQVSITIPASGNYRIELVSDKDRLALLTLSIDRQ